MTIRIGTWNLDRSGVRNTTRWGRQLREIEQRNCDVWILTEAHRRQRVGADMYGTFSSPGEGIYKPEECAVAVWTRLPVNAIPVLNARLSVCVEIDCVAFNHRVLVYGTVIPYAEDGVRSGEVQRWERHRHAVDCLLDDCTRLRKEHPDSVLVVAGDFNMNLDETLWYGTDAVKRKLREGLEQLGMHCCTLVDLRKDFGMSRANVDHIWVTSNIEASEAEYWLDKSSDHNGAVVSLSAP